MSLVRGYNKAMVIRLLSGFFLAGIFIILSVFLFENSFFLLKADLNFKLKEERVLGDDTENSLYQIIDGEKVYYLATNKILENSKLGAGVKYLGSDIFWNPERCAQMKSFYTKEKIYFLDSYSILHYFLLG
jgi:hypothetical protein